RILQVLSQLGRQVCGLHEWCNDRSRAGERRLMKWARFPCLRMARYRPDCAGVILHTSLYSMVNSVAPHLHASGSLVLTARCRWPLLSRGLNPGANLSDCLNIDVPEFHLTALALELHDYVGATILELSDDLYGCGLDRLLAELLAIVKRGLLSLFDLLQCSERLEFVH